MLNGIRASLISQEPCYKKQKTKNTRILRLLPASKVKPAPASKSQPPGSINWHNHFAELFGNASWSQGCTEYTTQQFQSQVDCPREIHWQEWGDSLVQNSPKLETTQIDKYMVEYSYCRIRCSRENGWMRPSLVNHINLVVSAEGRL